MINKDSSAFERQQSVFLKHSRFNIDTHRFSGKESYDGHKGGFPLLFDRESRNLVLDPSDSHMLCYGASGSKKTRAFVMPTIKALGFAGESMIINDPKGELYERSAKELKELGYNIIVLSLRNPGEGFAWNPLYIPFLYYKNGDYDKANEFANDMANILTLSNVSRDDPFWNYSSYNTLYGLILLLLRYCKDADLPASAANIANLMALRRKLFENTTNARNSDLWQWASQDELIAASLSGSIQAPKDTMLSILSVLDNDLRSFSIRPSLLEMLSNNDIDIEQIGNERTAVFLITPDEKTAYLPLVSLFISQSYQYLIYSAQKNGGKVKNRINYILDEFSSLPAIGTGSDFSAMITAARSRNIRFCIVVQSKNQLKKRYEEEAETIIANCTNQLFFYSRELELLQELSKLCGEKRDRTPNVSVYDLQHFDKDKNEALILCGRLKPCIVCMLSIDDWEKTYKELEIVTPERKDRIHIDFSKLDIAIQGQIDKIKEDRMKRMSELMGGNDHSLGVNNPFSPGDINERITPTSIIPPSNTMQTQNMDLGDSKKENGLKPVVAEVRDRILELEQSTNNQ